VNDLRTQSLTSVPTIGLLHQLRMVDNVGATCVVCSGIALLSDAAKHCEDEERKKDILITRAQEAYDVLTQVWPKTTGKTPALPSNESCRIANEYYVRSAPTFRTEILFLGESHCETPSSILGKKMEIDHLEEEQIKEIKRLIPKDDFEGHINLVHCITYGESWLLDKSEFSQLSFAEQQSVARGTTQFWKVLAVLAGDCTEHKNTDGSVVYDPLDEENFRTTFLHIVGSEKGNTSRLSRVAEKLRILRTLREKGIVLADVCPVPIYSGIGNTVKRENLVTGVMYTDRQKKLSDKEKDVILRTCWEHYGQYLVQFFNPRRLVILGVGVEKALGYDTLHTYMESLSGEYLGAIKHPSYNKLQGQNAIPLLRELRDICTCIGKTVDYKEEYYHNLDEDNRKSIKKEVEATEPVVLTHAEADDMIASILIHEMEVDEMVGRWIREKNETGQLGEMD
jgi:hypothetical protein